MTSHQLATVLRALPDHDVVVAEHGHLALVTHGATELGAKVVILYVQEPEPTDPEASA